jgi:uncharacterized protein (TIGR00251 family)
MPRDSLIRTHPDGLLIRIYVQPRAAKNAVAGIHANALKLRLTAPPVDGAANKMCLQFLAKQLRVPKSALQIASGHTSRSKTILCRCERMTGSKIECTKVKSALESLIGHSA